MKLEKSFVVARDRDALLPALDDDATFGGLFPDTRIVSHRGSRRETSTPFTAMGQSRDIRFVFETLSDGNVCFEKICDGNVWRSLKGEVLLERETRSSTRVVLRMEGQTRTFVPELAIRGPMREQIEEMAQALRARLEDV
jgi:hypothetical protein